MNDELEGYSDGLAGIGMQTRDKGWWHVDDDDYGWGFVQGSLDRKTMLTRNTPDAFALWAEGMGDGDA